MRRHQHLGVVPGSGQFAIARQQRLVEFSTPRNGLAQNIRSQGMKGASRGVDDDQALFRKHLHQQPGKGLAEGGFAGIEALEVLEQRSETKQIRSLIKLSADVRAESYGADRLTGVVRRIEGQRMQFVTRGQGNMIGLGEVMIFCGQPKDRDVRRARGGCVMCFAYGGRGLEQRKQRPAEQCHLLPGDHGTGTSPQPGDVGVSRRATAETAILLFEQVGNRLTPSALQRRRPCHPPI